MVRAVIFDFGRVFIFPKDDAYFGSLNDLHKVLSESPNYVFADNFVFNQELLDFVIKRGLTKNYSIYLFTRGKIQGTVDCQRFLNGYFKEIFVADKLDLNKDKPSSYTALSKRISIKPQEILYIDDDIINTKAAESAGCQAITFRNNMQLETEIEGYL